MQRSALRKILRSLLASIPLGALPGCPTTVAGGNIAENYYVPLPDGGVAAAPGERLPEPLCAALCDWGDHDGGVCKSVDTARPHECRLSADGGTDIYCQDYRFGGCFVGGGRSPAGLRPAKVHGSGAVGAFLAGMAHLEAASVEAFAVLERELRERGAPRRLIVQAARARRDERRHGRSVATLARRYGGRVPPAVVDAARAPAARALVDIALENAVEGCVNETFGALLAGYQARHAGDAALGRAMRAIEADETRHAELAWEVAAWLDARLTVAERRRVAEARRQAGAVLVERAGAPVDRTLVRDAGLPPAATARALAAAAHRALFA